MIDYDGRAWLAILLRVRGSVIPRLLPRVAVAAAIGIAAVVLLEQRGVKIPTLAHTLVGVALGLLLVFRTNASYDRYWEGRRLVGGIVNRSRDLARQVAAYDAEARAAFCRLIPAFFWLASQTLRRSTELGRATQVLTGEQQRALDGVVLRAPMATRWMTEQLRAEATAGRLTEQRLQLLDANLRKIPTERMREDPDRGFFLGRLPGRTDLGAWTGARPPKTVRRALDPTPEAVTRLTRRAAEPRRGPPSDARHHVHDDSSDRYSRFGDGHVGDSS